MITGINKELGSFLPEYLFEMVRIFSGLGDTNTQKELEVYNPSADSWTVLSQYPQSSFDACGVGSDNYLYFHGVDFSAIYKYDSGNDTWLKGFTPIYQSWTNFQTKRGVNLSNVFYLIGVNQNKLEAFKME